MSLGHPPSASLPTATRRTRSGLIGAFGLFVAASPAWAYIDPNTGGWLYQLLFPVLVAIGAAWAGLRYKLREWWDRLRGRKDETSAPTEPSDRRD